MVGSTLSDLVVEKIKQSLLACDSKRVGSEAEVISVEEIEQALAQRHVDPALIDAFKDLSSKLGFRGDREFSIDDFTATLRNKLSGMSLDVLSGEQPRATSLSRANVKCQLDRG